MKVTIGLSNDVLLRVDREAKTQGLNRTDLIRTALDDYLLEQEYARAYRSKAGKDA